MSTHATGGTPYYYVPAPSRHPFMAALGLLFVIFGAAEWMAGHKLPLEYTTSSERLQGLLGVAPSAR